MDIFTSIRKMLLEGSVPQTPKVEPEPGLKLEGELPTGDKPADLPVMDTENEKEYLGKTAKEEHYYLIKSESDLKVADATGEEVFSAKEKGMDPEDVVSFLEQAKNELKLVAFDPEIVQNYIVKPAEEKLKKEQQANEVTIDPQAGGDSGAIIPEEPLKTPEELADEKLRSELKPLTKEEGIGSIVDEVEADEELENGEEELPADVLPEGEPLEDESELFSGSEDVTDWDEESDREEVIESLRSKYLAEDTVYGELCPKCKKNYCCKGRMYCEKCIEEMEKKDVKESVNENIQVGDEVVYNGNQTSIKGMKAKVVVIDKTGTIAAIKLEDGRVYPQAKLTSLTKVDSKPVVEPPKREVGKADMFDAQKSYAMPTKDRKLGESVSSEEAKSVAMTIAQQLGGIGKLKAMIGAKDFSYDTEGNGSLIFKLMKGKDGIKAIKITLNGMDTYDVKFWAMNGIQVKMVKEVNGVYNDGLKDVIQDTTGLALSLGTMGKETKQPYFGQDGVKQGLSHNDDNLAPGKYDANGNKVEEAKLEEGVGRKQLLKLRNDIRKLELSLGLDKEAWLPSEGTIEDGRAMKDYPKMQRLLKKLQKMADDRESYVKESKVNEGVELCINGEKGSGPMGRRKYFSNKEEALNYIKEEGITDYEMVDNSKKESKVNEGTYRNKCKKCGHWERSWEKKEEHECDTCKSGEKKEVNETLETSIANKIMDIDNAILDKYNHMSGRDLLKHQKEFLGELREIGITSITQEDADALEDNNYHTALEILMGANMVQKKVMEAGDTELTRGMHKEKLMRKMGLGGTIVDQYNGKYMVMSQGKDKYFMDFDSAYDYFSKLDPTFPKHIFKYDKNATPKFVEVEREYPKAKAKDYGWSSGYGYGNYKSFEGRLPKSADDTDETIKALYEQYIGDEEYWKDRPTHEFMIQLDGEGSTNVKLFKTRSEALKKAQELGISPNKIEVAKMRD